MTFQPKGKSRTDWPIARLKHITRSIGGGTPDKSKPEFWAGDIPWVSPKDMKGSRIADTEDHISDAGLQSSATKIIEPNAVLIVMRSGILRHSIPVAINEVSVALNQDMRALVPDERLLPEFLAMFIRGNESDLLRTCGRVGATVESLESDLLGDTQIPIPTRAEQIAIVSYLASETSRIDALIAAKQRQLDLISEKRKAVIAWAVTRGIDPAAPMRGSGVPWLGEVPAHWEIERARWLFRERDARSETGEEEMLTVSHITGVTPRSEKDVNMFEAETNEGYKVCLQGDLVINTLWAWMGAMGVAPIKGIVSPAYNVYETGPRLESGYVDLLVRLPVFAQEVTRYSKGVWSSRLRLYPEGFFETFFPVPPLDEQAAVVSHIARETAKLDNVRDATVRTIELLRQRHSALIAAAVTGQIDVGAAA
jgi:type I restriction enzyme, S subunit